MSHIPHRYTPDLPEIGSSEPLSTGVACESVCNRKINDYFVNCKNN